MKTRIILIISLALATLLVIALVSGCSFRVFEGFEDTKDAAEPENPEVITPPKKEPLTPLEKEMFENIRKGNITDEDIQKFISEGKLTEKMVERFLDNIDAIPLPSVKPTTASGPKKPVTPPEEKGFDIEGFTGSQFAKF